MLIATKTRVLVVDDSALMRKHLASIFSAEEEFEVAVARNGVEALRMQREFKPDVITLDVNMPEMDGLTALSVLMAQGDSSVIMVSSLTEKGAMTTFEALALGAVDFIPKPGGTISLSVDDIREQLLQKVRTAARHQRRKSPVRKVDAAPRAEPAVKVQRAPVTTTSGLPMWPFGVVCIGVSTGGPRVLEQILPALSEDFPWPILVAQHMPPTFTHAFANRLNGLCKLQVEEVARPMLLKPGHVYIGKGGTDMVVSNRLGKLHVVPKPENAEHLWHPSVEAMLQSVIKHVNPCQCVGVMLTGMGYDGAQAMADLKQAGARTIAESEQTATVFGMPAELIRRNGAGVVLPSDQIANQLALWLTTGEQRWA